MDFNIPPKAFLLFAALIAIGLVLVKPSIASSGLVKPKHLIKVLGLVLIFIAMGGFIWIFN